MDRFHSYAKVNNDQHSEMQLKFQDSQNPCGVIVTLKMGKSDLNLTAAYHAGLSWIFRYSIHYVTHLHKLDGWGRSKFHTVRILQSPHCPMTSKKILSITNVRSCVKG
jgi:hypothetical protein